MWYDVDFKKLAVLLLPTFLRKPVLVGYVQALFAPLATLHYKWKVKRDEDFYKLEHTGQRFSLRKVLNDTFDPEQRRLYTANGNAFPRNHIYTRAEKKPVFLGKMYLYQRSEFLNTGVDFIVFVPQEILDTQLYEVQAIVDFYKIEPKRYQIRPI